MEATRPRSEGEASTGGPLRATFAALLDLLFPWDCVGCRRSGGAVLCDSCRSEIPWIRRGGCTRCGAPEREGVCAPCRLRPPAFSRARAISIYGHRGGRPDPLGEALRALKYGRRRALGAPLGRLLARVQPFARGEHDLVLPVPLHIARLRERGFNQAVLLARPVARCLGLPIAFDALARVRATPPQASLDEAERRRNVHAAFRVRRPEAIRDRRILLVDDVITSGATAEACALALRWAGARSVDVLGLARTPHPGPR